jgi:hypothetical protein
LTYTPILWLLIFTLSFGTQVCGSRNDGRVRMIREYGWN